MMDWTQLKYAESAWNLNDSQKRLLADRVQTAAQRHRQLYLPPIWKPFAAAAALCAFAFVMLLAWPKAPMEEQIVTLPGSSEARPDEYVPNEQEPDLPQKEPAVQVVPSEQEDEPAPTPQEQGISFADAAAIAKEKAFRQKFNNPLTEQEREALTVYLGAENYYYLKAQQEGLIGAFKENGTKDYTLEIQVFTTENELGSDLIAREGWKFPGALSKEGAKVISYDEGYYPRALSKEGSETYLQNLSLAWVPPEARIKIDLTLNKPLTKTESTDLISQFLSAEEVVWVEMNYMVKEDSSNPTAVHRFWETQKEISFDEARAIVEEKITRRFNEKLSDKERMAYYIVIMNRVKQLNGSNYDLMEQKEISSYSSFIRFTTTKAGIGLKPAEDLDIQQLYMNGGRFIYYDKEGRYDKEVRAYSEEIYSSRKDLKIYLPNQEGKGDGLSRDKTTFHVVQEGLFFSEFTLSGAKDPSVYDPKNPNGIFEKLIKQYLSLDCVTWVDCESDLAVIVFDD